MKNPAFLEQLANIVKNMQPIEKVIVLGWDEMSLHPHLDYDQKKDKIVGCEEWGDFSSEDYADHAMVCMVREVFSGRKIPIGYGFCTATTPTPRLKEQLKEIITCLTNIGFKVKAAVADQGATNQGAVNELIKETDLVREKHRLQPRKS